ncbi:MAG: hypothetical protein HY422_00105 [Candidatus Komeilibacteria bacterium]|nr:hypothetical protein [Candidatus Komeilibacteria bacterium]
MKRYTVSREHDEFEMCQIAFYIDGTPGIQIVKIVNEDRVIADLTDDAVQWIRKFFPAFTVQPFTEVV